MGGNLARLQEPLNGGKSTTGPNHKSNEGFGIVSWLVPDCTWLMWCSIYQIPKCKVVPSSPDNTHRSLGCLSDPRWNTRRVLESWYWMCFLLLSNSHREPNLLRLGRQCNHVSSLWQEIKDKESEPSENLLRAASKRRPSKPIDCGSPQTQSQFVTPELYLSMELASFPWIALLLGREEATNHC